MSIRKCTRLLCDIPPQLIESHEYVWARVNGVTLLRNKTRFGVEKKKRLINVRTVTGRSNWSDRVPYNQRLRRGERTRKNAVWYGGSRRSYAVRPKEKKKINSLNCSTTRTDAVRVNVLIFRFVRARTMRVVIVTTVSTRTDGKEHSRADERTR